MTDAGMYEGAIEDANQAQFEIPVSWNLTAVARMTWRNWALQLSGHNLLDSRGNDLNQHFMLGAALAALPAAGREVNVVLQYQH